LKFIKSFSFYSTHMGAVVYILLTAFYPHTLTISGGHLIVTVGEMPPAFNRWRSRTLVSIVQCAKQPLPPNKESSDLKCQ
jgi:hypothetical protein